MLVKKGGQIYLYESVRENGEIKTRYKGKLSVEQIQKYQQRKEEQALRKQSYQQIVSLMHELDTFRTVNDLLMRASLLVHNHYLYRSEIRRFNNE